MARFKPGDLVALNCDVRDFHASYPSQTQDWNKGQTGIVLRVIHEGYLKEKSVQVLIGSHAGWFFVGELDPIVPPLGMAP